MTSLKSNQWSCSALGAGLEAADMPHNDAKDQMELADLEALIKAGQGHMRAMRICYARRYI